MFRRPKKSLSSLFQCYDAPERQPCQPYFLNSGFSSHDKISLKPKQKKNDTSQSQNSLLVCPPPQRCLQLRQRIVNASKNIHFSYKNDDHQFNIIVKKPSFEESNEVNQKFQEFQNNEEENGIISSSASTTNFSLNFPSEDKQLEELNQKESIKQVHSSQNLAKQAKISIGKMKVNRFYSTSSRLQPSYSLKQNKSQNQSLKNSSIKSNTKQKASKSMLSQTQVIKYESIVDKQTPSTPITASNSQLSLQNFKELQNSAGFFYNKKLGQRKSIFCMRVRKTETVMTDKASEVENSILIDNYEGLLAKIQEHRLLEDSESQFSQHQT